MATEISKDGCGARVVFLTQKFADDVAAELRTIQNLIADKRSVSAAFVAVKSLQTMGKVMGKHAAALLPLFRSTIGIFDELPVDLAAEEALHAAVAKKETETAQSKKSQNAKSIKALLALLAGLANGGDDSKEEKKESSEEEEE